MRRLAAVTAIVFVVLLAFLAGRVRAGSDPAQVATPVSSVATPALAADSPPRTRTEGRTRTRTADRSASRLATHRSPTRREPRRPPLPLHGLRGPRAARVRGRSTEAELERLAARVRALLEDAECADALRPRERPLARERRPAPGRAGAAARGAARARRRAGRARPAAGSSTRRCSGELEARRLRGLARRPLPASLDAALAALRRGGPRARAAATGVRARCRSSGRPRSRGRRASGWTRAASARGSPPTSPPRRVPSGVRYAISCGGDLAVGGGTGASRSPARARARRSIGSRVPAAASRPRASTSGCGGARDGDFAHHLLDPSTGEPAWTGLVAAIRGRTGRARGRGPGQVRRCCPAPRGPARARAPRRRAPARRRPRRGHRAAPGRAAPAAGRRMTTRASGSTCGSARLRLAA